jgi:hypothetical protein
MIPGIISTKTFTLAILILAILAITAASGGVFTPTGVSAEEVVVDPNPKLPSCGNGDVNNDGFVTQLDTILTMEASINLVQLTEQQITRANVDGNGIIDIFDVIALMQFVNGATNTFPVCSIGTISVGIDASSPPPQLYIPTPGVEVPLTTIRITTDDTETAHLETIRVSTSHLTAIKECILLDKLGNRLLVDFPNSHGECEFFEGKESLPKNSSTSFTVSASLNPISQGTQNGDYIQVFVLEVSARGITSGVRLRTIIEEYTSPTHYLYEAHPILEVEGPEDGPLIATPNTIIGVLSHTVVGAGNIIYSPSNGTGITFVVHTSGNELLGNLTVKSAAGDTLGMAQRGGGVCGGGPGSPLTCMTFYRFAPTNTWTAIGGQTNIFTVEANASAMTVDGDSVKFALVENDPASVCWANEGGGTACHGDLVLGQEREAETLTNPS